MSFQRASGARLGILAVAAILLFVVRPAPAGQSPVQYVDVTEASGIVFQHTFGDDHMSSILEATGSGCAFLDYDNDGLIDLFAVNGSYVEGLNDEESDDKGVKTTSRLFHNLGGGKFEDVSVKAGVAVVSLGMGVIAADYDNDGFTDIFVTNYAPSVKDKDLIAKNPQVLFRNMLYRNNGNGTFTDVAEKAGVARSLWSVGAVFFDYDNDGWLDLFVGNYLDFDRKYRLYYSADEFPGPLSYPSQQAFLYRNNKDGTFSDVTKKAGIEKNSRAMGVTSADFDNDGFMDIYVANDAMECFLYKNSGKGTFTEIALESGTAFAASGDYGSAMSGEIGDYNGDGLLDLFVPDIKYKNLYKNLGKEQFEHVSASRGIAELCGQFASWGGGFLDYDHDGDLDLLVSNGNEHIITNTQENLLLENVPGPDGQRVFKDAGPKCGPYFLTKNIARGACIGDMDNDGDLDFFILALDQGSKLLRNDGGNKAHWIQIALTGTKSNRDGVGARVSVKTGDKVQIREKVTADSYLSQHDPRIHVGLGESKSIDVLTVRWPSGAVQELKDVPSDQILKIKEPSGK